MQAFLLKVAVNQWKFDILHEKRPHLPAWKWNFSVVPRSQTVGLVSGKALAAGIASILTQITGG